MRRRGIQKAKNIVFVFIALCALFSVVAFRVATWFIPSIEWPTRSIEEGRYFQVEPEPIIDNFIAREYQTKAEQFIADHVPFRYSLITVNGCLHFLVLNQPQSDRVIAGTNGWLFYNSGIIPDGDSIADYQGTNLFSESELDLIESNVLKMKTRLESDNRRLIIMITPNKESIYGEQYLPDHYGPKSHYRRVDQVVERLERAGVAVVNSEEAIVATMGELDANLYYKAGTHWNELGAYCGTRALLEALGESLLPLSGWKTNNDLRDTDLATMAAIIPLVDDVEYVVPGYRDASAATPPRSALTVTMVHDSFGMYMKSFLDSHFEKVDYINRADGFSENDIYANHSDVVVIETTERYLDFYLGSFTG